jgi:nitrate/TMAO reductase-like tetraheme cytochrome c subunit
VAVIPIEFIGRVQAQEVADQFKCPACHLEKLRELKRPKGPILIDPASIWQGDHGEQEAASTQRMCLSCHDGFVEDARYVWSDGHMTHPVGVTLPESMTIAVVDDEPVFPLNEDGEVYCGTCHTGHLGEGAAEKAPVFLRVDSEKGQICSNCHADKTEIAGSAHASVRARRQPPDFATRGICGSCHVSHENKGPLLWAKAPGEGNTVTSKMCNSCHRNRPSPAEHPATVLAWSQPVRETLGVDPATEMPVFDAQAHNASRGMIGCPTCHNPHKERPDGLAAEVPGHFLRLATTEGFMCADCHASSALFRYKFFHSSASR